MSNDTQDTFWSGTPTQATSGQSFTIKITDPGSAGETITVGVEHADGTPGNPASVDITLDQDGKGSASYTAPTGTAFLTLSAEGQSDHTVDMI